jgi:hypothetical protein
MYRVNTMTLNRRWRKWNGYHYIVTEEPTLADMDP